MPAKKTTEPKIPTDYEIITKARKLINTPDKWCQGSYGVDKNGLTCKENVAVRRCVHGAFRTVLHHEYNYTMYDALYKISGIIKDYFNMNSYDLLNINDGLGDKSPEECHKALMKEFTKAAKSAKAAE